ncbi:RNA polymerase sigma factor [Streptococcus agalactiae]|uniref:RNA polymerase sigma factor n=1 Tax=Streptococcus agalactiae TaxID=1311 RepID=UPI0011414A5F|nr:RNA polymerase sigma factor [Streptococcus agalactiae]TQC07453.1 RNA polymerase subunit sigma-70 [Streptococcus agalactiae]HEO7372043.1 RNA polymerase sigma factor [Streptococcus agalactiae]
MSILDDYEKELLVISHQIIAYLIKSGVNPSQAQDVTQDVFLQILESDFSLPLDKIKAWMYRTTIRRYIDLYRRNKRYNEILQKEFFIENNLYYTESEKFFELHEAILHLKKDYQTLIDLYYFNDFSIKEISEITGQSQSTIKIRLMRARREAKKYLEKDNFKI